MQDEKRSDYEGRQEHIRDMQLPEIEVWENKYPDRDYKVHLDILEFSCICPKTGLPDFAQFELDYVPDKWCVELKSLKLYLTAYRNIGIFHEHVVNRIVDDIVKACNPRYLKLKGIFNIRGGIRTTVEREYVRE